MRRPASLLLLSLLALGLLAAPASASAVTPRAASRFVDSIGVNVHMTYKDTAYADRERVVRILEASGIRHVRDGLSYDTQYAYDSFNELADHGIKTTFIMGDPTESRDSLPDLLATLRTKVAGAAEAVEGPNEYSRSGRPNWPAELRGYQSRLYRAVKSDSGLRRLPVIAPSLITWQDHARLGPIGPTADYGNKHSYPGGDLPEANVTDELRTAGRMTGARPTIVTESGYHNAVNSRDGHLPASEAAAGTYLPRMFLEYFRRGIPRTFTYELLDEWPDPRKANLESDFGLLRHDFSPKPAYRSLTNLIAVLGGDGAAVTPRPLGYRIEGAPEDMRQLLLQKADGTYALVLWRAVRVWDPQTRRAVTPDTRSVSVDLDAPATTRLIAPVRSRRPYASTSGQQVSVALRGDPVVVEIAPPGGRGIAVPAGQRIRTVLRRGLRVHVRGAGGTDVRMQARYRSRVLGRLAVAATSSKTRTLRLRPTAAGRRVLRRALRQRRPVPLVVRARLAGRTLVSAHVKLRR